MNANANYAGRMAGPAFLLLGLLGGIASAGKGNHNMGGDDVGSMPDSMSDDAPSLMMFASMADVGAAILDVQGPGEVLMRQVEPNRVLVEFEGTLSVALDPSVIAQDDVLMLFGTGTTFAGGSADVFFQGAWTSVPEISPLAVRELPLAFFANEVSPTMIHAVSVDRHEFSLLSTVASDAVVVRQTVR